MRCKYTKFLYRANGCEIFFFVLTISLLTFLLENAKISQVLLSLNDRLMRCKYTSILNITIYLSIFFGFL